MPDHIHLFVQGDPRFDLGRWIGGLKRVVAAAGPRMKDLPPVTAAATTSKRWRREIEEEIGEEGENGEAVEL